MLFNSFEFLIFFPIIVLSYFLIPYRFRWSLLLIASYYFYMSWKVEYAILILLSTVITYWSGILMSQAKTLRIKKAYLAGSFILTLLILFIFKYFNFFNESIRQILALINFGWKVPDFSLLLPIGISFYTFQALSYSMDIYRGKIEPERHFGIFALYVSFFPQLVAGPIERPGNLIPQLYKKNNFDYERVVMGLHFMAWGMFKKIVIADRLAIYVDKAYADVSGFSGLSLLIATILFAFQIFCDFSGYSDIAIGAAQVMGIRLMKNFRQPYFSKTIAEFWSRWHISLSTWFKDYLYIPLGGNRVPVWRKYVNYLVTFVVSGLWHGANWTFIIWGALHGFYMIFGAMTKDTRDLLMAKILPLKVRWIRKYIQWLSTFSLVVFAWIFFRAESIREAFMIVHKIGFDIYLPSLFSASTWQLCFRQLEILHYDMWIIPLTILFMESVHFIDRRVSFFEKMRQMPMLLRWIFYFVLIESILILGKFGGQEFIYFQF